MIFSRANVSPKSLLIVDDEEAITWSLRKAFERAGNASTSSRPRRNRPLISLPNITPMPSSSTFGSPVWMASRPSANCAN